MFVAVVIAIAVLLHPTQFRSGWMYLRSGKIDDAIASLSSVSLKRPNDYRALRMLAEALEEDGQTDEARKYYEKVVAIKPNDNNFRELIRFYSWTQQPEQALLAGERWYDYRKSNNIPFDDEDGGDLLRALYYTEMLFQNYRKAIDILKEYKKVTPSEAVSIDYDLIDIYEMSGDLSSAVQYLEDMLKGGSFDAYALEKFSDLAPFAGKTDLALYYLTKDMEDRPHDVAVWRRLVSFNTRIGDLNAVKVLYQKRLKQEPENERLKKDYVNWLIGNGEQLAAINYLETTPEVTADLLYRDRLTKLYEWHGMKEKLAPIYQSHFDNNPNDRGNAKKLVWILIDLKRENEAENALRRLVNLCPLDREYVQMLVDFYDGQKREAASIAVLENFVRVSGDTKFLKRLGEHYLWKANDQNSEPAPK